MKKAKLMLSVLTIMNILSLIFAFKMKDFSSLIIYTGKLKSGSCITKVEGVAILKGIPNAAASTAPVTKNCPDVFTVAIGD